MSRQVTPQHLEIKKLQIMGTLKELEAKTTSSVGNKSIFINKMIKELILMCKMFNSR